MMRAARNAGVAAAIILRDDREPAAAAAGKARGATATRAEIQIALCAPPDQIEHALDLRSRGAPIKVWLFDDAALTLFEHGLRLRLHWRMGAPS